MDLFVHFSFSPSYPAPPQPLFSSEQGEAPLGITLLHLGISGHPLSPRPGKVAWLGELELQVDNRSRDIPHFSCWGANMKTKLYICYLVVRWGGARPSSYMLFGQ